MTHTEYNGDGWGNIEAYQNHRQWFHRLSAFKLAVSCVDVT
jgi:hypothetical protein